ncbi:DUF5990 family protein [Yinghuangia seranimata]|uniref:DUF5990 family protein n=1 Tax=Yinghuangia seranimata TaxID=408067 RepID=UPI00248BA22D|nr:DUF5990 family protein [Yinghuangia seranimata]MDI2125739.1 DUF5990 family protein [Yinghuangia seranimata]
MIELRIDAVDLPGTACPPAPGFPGYDNIHVAVQRRERPTELLGLTPGDAASASWALECTATPVDAGLDLKGPYVQGRPGGRFVYLSWGSLDDAGTVTMFRRAKLWLDGGVPADVLAAAVDTGLLVGRLGLTDGRGAPLCASVRPPMITWTAGTC